MDMSKKIIKFIGILILVIAIINVCTIISNAAVIKEGVGTDAIEKFEIGAKDKFTDTKNKSISTTQNALGAIVGIVQTISITVAVVMLMILAIKYIMSSVQERAEIKKHAVVYVIGALLIFSVNGIIEIIQLFSSNIYY